MTKNKDMFVDFNDKELKMGRIEDKVSGDDILKRKEKLEQDTKLFLEEQVNKANEAIEQIKKVTRIYPSDEEMYSTLEKIRVNENNEVMFDTTYL